MGMTVVVEVEDRRISESRYEYALIVKRVRVSGKEVEVGDCAAVYGDLETRQKTRSDAEEEIRSYVALYLRKVHAIDVDENDIVVVVTEYVDPFFEP